MEQISSCQAQRFTRVIAGFVSLVAGHAGAQEFIPLQSVWRYVDDGVNRYTESPPFQSPLYGDASWKTGSGRFGYGGDGEATTVLYGSSSTSKFITTYFRHEFNWDGIMPPDADTLMIEYSRDDGAMIYLNGNLIERSNMPAGTVGNTTRATVAIGGNDEWKLIQRPLDLGMLLPGRNVIAVAVHQNVPDSTDLGFDLRAALTRRNRFFHQTEMLAFPHQVDKLLGLLDVTGDGAPELFTSYAVANDHRLQMRVNNGRGDFGTPQDIDAKFYMPSVMKEMNLNGDTLPDLMAGTLNATSREEIRSYIGDGVGGFVRTTSVNAGSLISLEVADLDGDGLDDIVELGVGATTFDLRWRRNSGIETFDSAVTLLTLPNDLSGSPPGEMIVADANADGRPDILVSAPMTSNVRLLLNQGGNNPSFTASILGSALSYCHSLASADLDEDGDADVLVVRRLSTDLNSAGLLLTFMNNGLGVFTRKPVPLPIENGLISPLLRDVDQDGDVDLVYGTGGTGIVVMYENDGRGNWVNRRSHDSPLYTYKSGQLAIGDVDTDGEVDVVHASRIQNEPVTWYRNMRSAPPRINSFTVTPDTIGAAFDVTLAWDVENATDIRITPNVKLTPGSTTATATVDQQTTFTLVATNGAGKSRTSATAFLATLSWPGLVTGPKTSYQHFGGAQLDVNGDGLLDISYVGYIEGVGQPGTYWAPMNADRTVGPPQLVLLDAQVYSPQAADLNGDGRLDLLTGIDVTGLRWLPVIAGGGVGPPRTIMNAASGKPLRLFAASDFDGDTDIDVATMQDERVEQKEILRTFINDGHGSFTAGLTEQPPPDFNTAALESADIDGDGLAELIYMQGSRSPYIGWNNGSLGFPSVPTKPALGRDIRYVHFADVNGDGLKDMLSIQAPSTGGYTASPEMYSELGRGDRLLGTRGGVLLFHIQGAGGFTGLATADLDRDGDLDLLVTREGNLPLHYALNNGRGAFSQLVLMTTQTIGRDGAHELLTGDIDGNGYPDALTFFTSNIGAIFNDGPPPPVLKVPNAATMTEDGRKGTIQINVSGLTRPQVLEFTLQPGSTASLDEVMLSPSDIVHPVPGQSGKWSLILQPEVSQVVLEFRTPDDLVNEAAEDAILKFSSPDPTSFDTSAGYGPVLTLTIAPSDFIFEGRVEVETDPAGVVHLRFSGLLPHTHTVESSLDLVTWTVLETLQPLADGTLIYAAPNSPATTKYFRARDFTLSPPP